MNRCSPINGTTGFCKKFLVCSAHKPQHNLEGSHFKKERRVMVPIQAPLAVPSPSGGDGKHSSSVRYFAAFGRVRVIPLPTNNFPGGRFSFKEKVSHRPGGVGHILSNGLVRVCVEPRRTSHHRSCALAGETSSGDRQPVWSHFSLPVS